MKTKIIFDSEALLAFYLGEKGADRVRTHLDRVQGGEAEGLLNIINLTELYYIIFRKNPRVAEEKEANLRAFGVKIVPVLDERLWKEAARIKGRHPLSLADAFAVATARIEKAKLLTGRDEELEGLGIELLRIR